jgi:hypothetical protein
MSDTDNSESRLAALEEQVSALRGPAPTEPLWNLGVIKIRRTADVIAFVALVLSLFTAIGQIVRVTDREDIASFSPHQIVISNNQAIQRPLPAENQVVFSVATQYMNRSSSGHIGVVESEILDVAVTLPDQPRRVQQFQYQVVRSHSTGGTTSTASGMAMDYIADPSAFAVSQEVPTTHEVLFIPFGAPICIPGDNACEATSTSYPWADFIADMDEVDKASPTSPMSLQITVLALIYGTPSRFAAYQQYLIQSAPCAVTLTSFDRMVLRNNGWLAPLCR